MPSDATSAVDTARFSHVCLAGAGACTSVGLTAAACSAAVRAGISGTGEHPYMRDKAGEPFAVSMVAGLEAANRLQRLHLLARMAANEALAPMSRASRTGLVFHLGLPELSEAFTEQACAALCKGLEHALVDDGVRVTVRPWPYGNAAGLLALQHVARLVERGDIACALVGGADSLVDADLLESLDQQGRVASSSNKWGFPPGEGASVLVVCRSDFAQHHGLQQLARVACLSVGKESNSMHSDGICVGKVLGAVFSSVVSAAGTQASDQFCDIDGDRYREHEFSYAILRVPGNTFRNATDYVTPQPRY
jgi:3-oxoacyl-[acyl-carrier-protein] synthase-1